MELQFSIIIPVYNRPKELDELLASVTRQQFEGSFEVLIVEDGSTEASDQICEKYNDELQLRYFFKENSGAGPSRNYGMEKAKGSYYIILDSDVILPEQYLSVIYQRLKLQYTDAFGGPDKEHPHFSGLQKAISYSMTSFLTTGGIRGKKNGIGKFQLRSFNMGLSQNAFEKTKGFSEMKTGEDIDLTFRLWQHEFETQLIADAFVYHKRRTSIRQFFRQTFAFGKARPLLSQKYPGTSRITYWFPILFLLGIDVAIIFAFFGELTFLAVYYLYFWIIFLHVSFLHGIRTGLLSVVTTFTQFLGYGLGFALSYISIISAKNKTLQGSSEN